MDIKEYKKQYYQKNKEYIKAKRKEYRQKNLEIVKQKNNEWYYKNHNKQLVKKWKRGAFKHTDEYFNLLSINYINATNCELCNVTFTLKGNNKKVCDHHHSSGAFRNICCHKCNMKRLRIENNYMKVLMELHRYFILNSY